jgi:GxxExxY protein
MRHEALTRRIIGAAMRVHSALGPGFLESVYLKALAWELSTLKLVAECERRLEVRYRGQLVGTFVADLVVDACVIVELKAIAELGAAHEAQLVNYLSATGIEIGLLLNFGGPSLDFRRRIQTPRRR